MNLIEQQNILKGLTDESLQAEMAQPTGTAPPFLIAAEVSRRKTMRESYEGDKARRGKTSTVMDDLMMPPAGGMSTTMPQQGAPQAPGGLAAAVPQAMPQQTAFAEGGLVGNGGLDYAALEERYNSSLNALPERRDRARALALLQAGAGIMGGGSSNFLTNIGKGVGAGTSYYGEALDNIDTEERALIRDALSLESTRNGDELQRMRFDFDREDAARRDALTREGWEQGNTPASIREAQMYGDMTPEEKANYDRLNPVPTVPSSEAARLKEWADLFQESFKAIPDPQFITPGEEAAVVAAKTQQAKILTYEKIKAIYGPDQAAIYARNAGLSDGDVLTGGAATGAPSGGAIGFEEYFQ